jgi:hypothetical protein
MNETHITEHNIRRTGIIILLAGIMLTTCLTFSLAQVASKTDFLDFEQLADSLGKKHNVRFYYRTGWFEMRKFNSSLLDMSLKEALERITEETGYSIDILDSDLYIFIPVSPERRSSVIVKTDVITIGDPDEFGKYTRATIKGRITDGTTKKPLPGASLFIDKLKIGFTADNKGFYTLPAPVGEHTVRLSFIGYDENTYRINLVGNGNCDFELFEKSIKLDEVIISAERPDINVSSGQMSYVKLDTRTIKELPVSFGINDLLKGITLLPGIQTVGEFGTGFNVRGGSSDQNLILLEDVPVFNPSHLFGLVSVINSDGISEATMIKAGIPAKYGERASSVLDIRFGPENPGKTVIKGGLGLIDSRIYIETPVINNKISLIAGARRSYSNWLLHSIPDIDLMNSSAMFFDANAMLTYNMDQNNRISLFSYISTDKFGFSDDQNYRYGNLLASLRWKHTFTNVLYFNLTAGLSNYKYYLDEPDSLNPEKSYKISSDLHYTNLKWNLTWRALENHSFELGFNSSFYNIKPGELDPLGRLSKIRSLVMPGEKGDEVSVYLSDHFDYSPDILIDAGLRYTAYYYLGPKNIYQFIPGAPLSQESISDSVYYNKNELICSYSGLEPRVSLRLRVNENSSVKISYNRIHQFANLISNTSVSTPSDIWKLSSPNLRPTVTDHVSAGYFRNFGNNKLETSAEVYYKWFGNGIDYKNGARILLNAYPETDLLNVKGSNYGIELFARKNTGKLTGWASYTLSKSVRRTDSKLEEEQINGNRLFPSYFDKPHNLVINFGYNLSRRWRVGGTFNYSTGRPVTLPEYKYYYQDYQLLYFSDRNKYRLPAYHRLDVAITYEKSLKIKKKWKGSWTFSVVNLYGRKNAYSVFYKKEDHMVSNQNRAYDNYMLYIIGRPLPTLTYSFSFTE